ncbi:MAG: RNA methyltransferase, partial [Chitinivibrionales bacterium]|nr:RNA methyltransferase [Chitinivibrionales bacterium]
VIKLPGDCTAQTLPQNPGDKILLLEDIQDPGNVGTLIRTAAAFNFSGIILSPQSADPFGPKAVAAAAGSVLALWTRRSEHYLDFASHLQSEGFTLIAADINGSPVLNKLPRQKIICALGNEGNGLSKALLDKADQRLKIPIKAQKAESLNVAVCGGIVMYLLSNI